MNNQLEPVSEVTEKACIDWKIYNFCEIFEKSQASTCIKSSKFQIVVHGQVTEWQLKLFPKGKEERFSKFMFLLFKCCSNVDAYVRASFAILNGKNKAVNIENISYTLFKGKYEGGVPQFIEHDDLFHDKQNLLFGDKLTIRCEIFLDKIEEYYENISNGRVEDFKDFGMLFNNEKLSDVTISVSDSNRKFYAHKHVLSKKSEVFSAMFKHDMFENNHKTVNIDDVPRKAMDSLLYYIYTGDIYNITNSTYLDLLKAADKYQVLDLKKLCENEILELLTIENCVDFLTAADQSNALNLKTKVIDFIVKNAHVLIKKPEFKSMTHLHPELWYELFRVMTPRSARRNH